MFDLIKACRAELKAQRNSKGINTESHGITTLDKLISLHFSEKETQKSAPNVLSIDAKKTSKRSRKRTTGIGVSSEDCPERSQFFNNLHNCRQGNELAEAA